MLSEKLERMLKKPGYDLDHAVAQQLQDDSATAPAYSTDETLADPLLSLLEKRGVHVSVQRTRGIWQVTLFARLPRVETIASGASRNRSLAICRAVANVVRWPNEETTPGLSLSAAAKSDSDGERGRCTSCGAPIRRRSRRAAKVLCSVCAWNAGKPALEQFEASRAPKSGRRRQPRGLQNLAGDFPEDL
jgi:hypothetical protein